MTALHQPTLATVPNAHTKLSASQVGARHITIIECRQVCPKLRVWAPDSTTSATSVRSHNQTQDRTGGFPASGKVVVITGKLVHMLYIHPRYDRLECPLVGRGL